MANPPDFLRRSLSAAPCGAALMAFALALLPGSSRAATATESQQFQVKIDGRRVGVAEWRWGNLNGQESYVEILWMRVAQRGGQADLSHRYELERAPGTQVLNFQRSFAAGAATQFQQGRISDGRVDLDRSSSGSQGPLASVPQGAVLPFDLVVRLRAASRSPWPDDAFVLFDMGSLAAVPAKVSGCEAVTAGQHCVHMATQGRSPRSENWYFGDDGALLRVQNLSTGLPWSLVRCEGSCEQKVEQPVDLVGRLVVASPFRIPKSASQQRLRFVLARADGAQPVLVNTGDQSIAFDGDKAVATVCRDCGDRIQETAATLAPYLRANAWVQSGAPEFRRMAVRVGGAGESVDARMRRSLNLVWGTMGGESGYIGYADALQTLRLRRGDCMGYALVLTALARAQGIPARVVYGMAYTDRFSGKREVFSPHAWVQSWDGRRWRSYDAALREFDSTHVALAVGSGDPTEASEAFLQLSQLRVERVGIVSPD